MHQFIKFVLMVWIVIALTLSAILIASGQRTAFNQAQMLNIDSCRLPCWNGIIPGTTTIGQARELIDQAYGNSVRFRIEKGANWLAIHNQHDTSTLQVVLEAENDNITLGSIEFQNLDSLSDMLDQLGTPNSIVLWGMGGGTFPTLIYEKQHTALVIDEADAPGNACVDKLMSRPVITVVLFSSLPDGWGFYQPQQWRGFTCYQWPPFPKDD